MERDYLEEYAPILSLIASRLSSDPDWALKLLEIVEPRLMLDMYRRRRDNADDAISAISAGLSVVRCNPDNAADKIALAHLFARAERLDEALDCVDEVIYSDPSEHEYHRLRASILERMHRLYEAEVAIGQACALRPDDSCVEADRARIAGAIEAGLVRDRDTGLDVPRAIQAAMELVRRRPSNVDDKVALARAFADAGHFDDASEWVERAISSCATSDGYQLKASLLERLGNLNEAAAVLESACAMWPDDARLLEDRTRIGRALDAHFRYQRDNVQDHARAIEAGITVVRRCPGEPKDKVELAHLLARAKRLTEALAWIDMALEADPDEAEYHRFRASILERLGNYKSARYAIKKAVSANPGNADLTRDSRRIARKWLFSIVRSPGILLKGSYE
ncbi:tetratricopeptide repeat protein [Burkholderia territorii]|uniref:tetratricopeptide repeat protein n=1 Tax=Burkholderia territorii TaxID=1503055 RepID=UPI0009C0ADBE|nr:tetratricopeptide repeat protein [Burkholderia territorii]